jgi:hypothetical protein
MQTFFRNLLNVYTKNSFLEEQSGFCKGRRSSVSVFTTQQIIENRKELNPSTYLLFTDCREAYDSIHQPTDGKF